ncbi:hypothetical protein BSKO_14073 [Bryopsis sp. KO-2023]|nr:hypothetical protein BSKO_14073 [Bryopsis sp. KO-2023]
MEGAVTPRRSARLKLLEAKKQNGVLHVLEKLEKKQEIEPQNSVEIEPQRSLVERLQNLIVTLDSEPNTVKDIIEENPAPAVEPTVKRKKNSNSKDDLSKNPVPAVKPTVQKKQKNKKKDGLNGNSVPAVEPAVKRKNKTENEDGPSKKKRREGNGSVKESMVESIEPAGPSAPVPGSSDPSSFDGKDPLAMVESDDGAQEREEQSQPSEHLSENPVEDFAADNAPELVEAAGRAKKDGDGGKPQGQKPSIKKPLAKGRMEAYVARYFIRKMFSFDPRISFHNPRRRRKAAKMGK